MDETRTIAARGDAPMPTRPSLRLTVVSGPDAGSAVEARGEVARIGRGDTVELRLRDPHVSQFHAELSVTPAGRVRVRDLGSRNGTHVGPAALDDAAVLPGTVLTLGATSVRVELGVAVESPESSATSFGALVGTSPAMRSLFALLQRLARTDLSVLIEGETGTGKELVARALHEQGRRAAGPFVVLDCSAVPATLAQSVLFGHEKGAFTGASERRVGVFEAAAGGTVFLDEVGELSPELQPMLLRVLQAREVQPLGASRPRPVDVRVLCATWRDLRAMINRGAFREDLFYRLAQATVRVPPLTAREGDVPTLVTHLLARIPPHVQAARSITPEALDALVARRYPGNVRELASTVERLALLADGPVITAADLAFDRMLGAARGPAPSHEAPPPPVPTGDEVQPFKEAKRTLVDEFERAYLARLLVRCDNNLSRAAAVADLKRFNLRELLKKHGLYDRRRDG